MRKVSEMIDSLKVGQRLQIPKDQDGNPIWRFDKKKRQYIVGKLQWFEVTAIDGDSVKMKAIWP